MNRHEGHRSRLAGEAGGPVRCRALPGEIRIQILPKRKDGVRIHGRHPAVALEIGAGGCLVQTAGKKPFVGVALRGRAAFDGLLVVAP